MSIAPLAAPEICWELVVGYLKGSANGAATAFLDLLTFYDE